MRYIRIIVYVFLLVLLFSCNESGQKMKIIYYDKGNVKNVDTSNLELTAIFNRIGKICFNTTQILRVHINDERIEQLKQEESGVEFILNKEIIIQSTKFGKYNVKKIFFPLSGDFIGNDESPVITVFLGKESYYPDALRNMEGYKELKELVNVVIKK